MAHQRTPSASTRGSPFHGATSSFTALLPPMFDAQPEELVVALYDFTPAATSTKSYLCLAFEAGDRIRVHSKDASGWWDGELLIGDSVAVKRGWFPSNFVKDYDGGMSAAETVSLEVACCG
jgi:son of sevenless-like protein